MEVKGSWWERNEELIRMKYKWKNKERRGRTDDGGDLGNDGKEERNGKGIICPNEDKTGNW